MKIGIGTGVTSPLCLRAGQTPRSLFRAGDHGLWLDASDIKSLMQDAAGTEPVTASGQSVGRIVDRSGNGINAVQASARLRPRYGMVAPALFRDDFDRSNTAAGTLGVAPSGQAWSLRAPYAGSYPLPPSSFGQITDGKFVVPGGQIVYAGIDLEAAPLSITCKWSWVDKGSGADFTTLAVLCSPATSWINTMLHVTVTNVTIKVQKRINGGAFIDMNAGNTAFGSPSLLLANTEHTLRLDIAGNTVRARVNDTRYDVSVTDPDIPGIVGRYLACEHYSASTNVRWPLSIRGFEAQHAQDAARPSRPAVIFDRVDDALVATLPAGSYTVAYASDAGATILTGQALSGAYAIPGPARLYGCVIIDRALSNAETSNLRGWLNARRP
ncbi:MAG: hypothetical protein ACK4GC_09905 [Paracoccaceae bacterium]